MSGRSGQKVRPSNPVKPIRVMSRMGRSSALARPFSARTTLSRGDAPKVFVGSFDWKVMASLTSARNQRLHHDCPACRGGTFACSSICGRLHAQGLIATGPRASRRGAPYTFVTTEQFLVHFGLESLRDLPDAEQLADAGMGPEDT